MQAAPVPPDPPSARSPERVRAIRDDGTVLPAFRETLDLGAALWRQMVRLRLLSVRMVELQREERVAFHAACVGEEAAIVGAVLAADHGDWIFPGMREWGASIVRGLPVGTYLHHAFGSALDPAKGHASPDHPPAAAHRIGPASGVVGAHLPEAVGYAWAARTRKASLAAVALFGDGASSTGDFHNALNFAGVFKAPCIFVCRNNGRAGATPVARQTRVETIAEKAVAYGIATTPTPLCGSDAIAVAHVVRAARRRAAEGKGATLVEVVTEPLSFDGHRDVLALGPADPIVRLRRALERESLLQVADADAFVTEVRAEIDRAVTEASSARPPTLDSMFDDVYAKVPPHLVAQRDVARAQGPKLTPSAVRAEEREPS